MDITQLVPRKRKGLVVVITGYGKGKSTTALGIAVRACGHNMRVCHDSIHERRIKEVKHAYRKGIEPQPGIDY
jgi:ATP:corrinoid adenosyltransferase